MRSKQHYTELADNILQAQGVVSNVLKDSSYDLLIADDIKEADRKLGEALQKVLLHIGMIEYYGLENEDNK